MRFEAKLTRAIDDWDDEAGELVELPADLSELGEQLHDDSRHLARLYPALTGQESSLSRTTTAEPDRRRKERRQSAIVFGTGASLVVLLCLTFGIVVSRPTPDSGLRSADHAIGESEDQIVNTSKPSPSNLLVVTAPIQHETAFSETDEITRATSYTVPRINVATPLSTRETSILNASGPQAEAYLDYIEMTSVRNVKLSF